MGNNTIYLDHAAITPPLPCALAEYNRRIAENFGNPSSGHAYGDRARKALECARERIAHRIGCMPKEVYFTSTATEAAAMVLTAAWRAGYACIPTEYDHHAISDNIIPIPNNRGDKDVMFCWTYVNNETGEIDAGFNTRIPSSAFCMCDATAAVGHFPVKFTFMHYLIADAIKFGGVPGAAFLIATDGMPLSPIIRGGGQERGIRAGTENVPAICAMSAALDWQCENMERNTLRVLRLNKTLLQRLDGTDYLVNARQNVETSPYILNLSFPGLEGSALALMLSNAGVMVSTGAACTTGDNAPSHVLMAMYGDEERARSAIRISFSHETTEEEVNIAAEKIKQAVSVLRGIGNA